MSNAQAGSRHLPSEHIPPGHFSRLFWIPRTTWNVRQKRLGLLRYMQLLLYCSKAINVLPVSKNVSRMGVCITVVKTETLQHTVWRGHVRCVRIGRGKCPRRKRLGGMFTPTRAYLDSGRHRAVPGKWCIKRQYLLSLQSGAFIPIYQWRN